MYADRRYDRLMFIPSFSFSRRILLERYTSHLSLPADFRNTLTEDLNSSFHIEYDFAKNAITRHTSWSLFKIKIIKTPSDYYWIQACVFVNWDLQTNQQRIIFLDVPGNQYKQLRQSFPTREMRDQNPYMWHAVFAHAMAGLYHDSFWSQRDVIRKTEKIRDASSENLPKLLSELNDSARHTVHLNETMEVAEDTMNRLLAGHAQWRAEFPEYVRGENNTVRGTYFQTRQKLAFVAKEIHSARIRSRTLTDRLASEVQLANTLVSHEMSRHSRYDNKVMKTLGIVGMVYLPGTFVSGIFGSNFFDFQSGAKESWEMSREFWLYWAVTIPLTLATFAVWALWHYRAKLGWKKSAMKNRAPIEDASEKV
ncbi:hypothetical protein BDV26DRAFT_268188 [Aspergillus bertholletiae]|uniref:Uncharacterized protein n=1 Tax=Aspergillus bertholletiae TaxID=1226010 RepID=A0A5N7AZJ5_9EURO|nr:hypothetical protein BDV26DRAFT_268188 [Aspergillus bertholletiae]